MGRCSTVLPRPAAPAPPAPRRPPPPRPLLAALQAHFQLARFADVTEFLTLVALKRGKLGKGGAADHDAAARAVLQEWNAGAARRDGTRRASGRLLGPFSELSCRCPPLPLGASTARGGRGRLAGASGDSRTPLGHCPCPSAGALDHTPGCRTGTRGRQHCPCVSWHRHSLPRRAPL